MSYHKGETVICSCLVKNTSGVLTNPANSMKITIYDSANGAEINNVDMVKDSTGTYHYDFQTASAFKGKYTVNYVAIDGTRISIETDTFELV